MAACVDQARPRSNRRSGRPVADLAASPGIRALRCGIFLVLNDVDGIALTRVAILEIGVFNNIRETHVVGGFKWELWLAAQLIDGLRNPR